MALSQFSGGGEQQLLLMLGAKPRFLTPKQLEEEDEEEREVRLQNQGKAWWTLDKACKNFVRVCWRRRNHIIGKHYIAKRALVLQTEPKEVVWNDDSPITIGPLRPLGTRRPTGIHLDVDEFSRDERAQSKLLRGVAREKVGSVLQVVGL